MKPTGGFGFTVKCKNSETHSLSVKIPDCAGPNKKILQIGV